MFQTRRNVKAAYRSVQLALQQFTEAAAKLRETTAIDEASAFIDLNSAAVCKATALLGRLKAANLPQVTFCIMELEKATEVLADMHANFSDLETNLQSLVGTADTWLTKIFEMSEAGWDVMAFQEAEIKLRALAKEGLQLIKARQFITAYFKYADAVQIIDGSVDPFACAESWASAVSYVGDSGLTDEHASDYKLASNRLNAFREMYGTAFEPWRFLHLRFGRRVTPEEFSVKILALSACIESRPSAKRASEASDLMMFCQVAHKEVCDLGEEIALLESEWFKCTSLIHKEVQLLQGRMADLCSEVHRRPGPQSAAHRMLGEIQREIAVLTEQVAACKITNDKTIHGAIGPLSWRIDAADKRSILASVWYVGLVTGLVFAAVLAVAFLVIVVATN